MRPIKGFSRPEDSKPARKPPSGIGAMVVHKSSQLLAFDKPAGLAVQTARADAPSLQRIASAYAKRDLYLIHRIDQPASGLVLFTRHRKTVAALQEQFAQRSVERVYLAVCDALPDAPEGELRQHLLRDGRTNKSGIVEPSTPDAKEAVLTWRKVGETDRYPVLEIRLQTGRHHQIRAQLAHAGAPIHGDVKYGARRANANRGIHLHALQLGFAHPISGEAVRLVAPLPEGDAIWAAAGEALPRA